MFLGDISNLTIIYAFNMRAHILKLELIGIMRAADYIKVLIVVF